MSHPFGNLLSQYLHRKHGLSQAKLASGVNQPPQIVHAMCKGERLTGPRARERVVAMLVWLQQQGVLANRDEANALLAAARMAGLDAADPLEGGLLQVLPPAAPATHGTPSAPPPPPAAPARQSSHLPRRLTSFIGRTHEVTELTYLVAHAHLITLTGVGGCGKSRLALQVATHVVPHFTDGVWWVALDALAEPDLVPQAIAHLFQLRDQPGIPLLEKLSGHLAAKHLLLVLDTCEHLLDACARLVDQLVQACPQLHLLLTSREPLSIEGEIVWTVPSLTVPDRQFSVDAGGHRTQHLDDSNLETLMQSEAVQLFVERARAVQPGFQLTPENASSVAAICRRLDGLPLALELAAARVQGLAIDQIADRLRDRFQLLTNGYRVGLLRHKTLRASIEWSDALLTEMERTVFYRLAVFAGGWTLEAAESICAGGGIEPRTVLPALLELVRKSLVLLDEQNAHRRYRLLETIRQYAGEKLAERGEVEEVRRRHLDFFCRYAEQTEGGPAATGTSYGSIFHAMHYELDNFRAALAFALQQTADHAAEQALQMSGALMWFWFLGGHLSEGRRWLEQALTYTGATGAAGGIPPGSAIAARALYAAGWLAIVQGNVQQASNYTAQSLSIYRARADTVGMAQALQTLGAIAMTQADYPQARVYLEESIALQRAAGMTRLLCGALYNRGSVALLEGDPEHAERVLQESVALAQHWDERGVIPLALVALGWCAFEQGDLPHARSYGVEALREVQTIPISQSAAASLELLGAIAGAAGRWIDAVRWAGCVDALRVLLGLPHVSPLYPFYERSIGTAEAALDSETFTATFNAGRMMPLEDAISAALQQVE